MLHVHQYGKFTLFLLHSRSPTISGAEEMHGGGVVGVVVVVGPTRLSTGAVDSCLAVFVY